MKFIMNWDQPQGPFRRAYTCHRPRHEGKDDQTSGNSRKRNSSTLACVETGCECMCVSGCLTCCRCPSAGHCQQSNFVSWPVCRLWTLSGEQLGVLAWVQTVDAVKRETSVSWPVCSLASDAVKILCCLLQDTVGRATGCPGLGEDWGLCQQSNFVSWPVCRLWTLSGEQLGVLAWVQTVDAVKRETSVSWPVCSLASDAVKILWTQSRDQLGYPGMC
ncbi:uncharacterized protein LOC126999230 isoform X28 [Eriocheir sinensis]|uniref:uncharacterized protein LOC126999230 isoform X28 n=1 Tax=Eriocheir sinensis TaxID=95602 RepID=UPI0021C5EE5E|nr:uncharacterized protein LOC126999230 isoform X28 [Eriocheir sinensis]